MRKIKQLSLVLFIFSVLAFSYPLTQVFAQDGGQCDSNPACDPTSGTCCNQCDSNPACVTSDLNAIPCCSTNDRSGPPGDMRGDHRGDRGDHRGPPDGGDPYAKQCKDWKEKGSPLGIHTVLNIVMMALMTTGTHQAMKEIRMRSNARNGSKKDPPLGIHTVLSIAHKSG